MNISINYPSPSISTASFGSDTKKNTKIHNGPVKLERVDSNGKVVSGIIFKSIAQALKYLAGRLKREVKNKKYEDAADTRNFIEETKKTLKKEFKDKTKW